LPERRSQWEDTDNTLVQWAYVDDDSEVYLAAAVVDWNCDVTDNCNCAVHRIAAVVLFEIVGVVVDTVPVEVDDEYTIAAAAAVAVPEYHSNEVMRKALVRVSLECSWDTGTDWYNM
jgi:hypothetical protein